MGVLCPRASLLVLRSVSCLSGFKSRWRISVADSLRKLKPGERHRPGALNPTCTPPSQIYDASVSSSHLPAVVQGLGPEDVMPSRRRNKDPLAADHWARVVAGLLYVGCG